MNMVSVSSSNLVTVGYDKASMTLSIQFKSGLYDYYNVPENIYNGLLNASSKGEYHHAFIKNSYRYNKVA